MKTKREFLWGPFEAMWSLYTHTNKHTYTQRLGERHIREITATWSGTLSIILGPLKPHRCSLTCPKTPSPLPQLSMWSFIRPQQETSKQNTSPGEKPLSLSSTWIPLEISVSLPDRIVTGSFCHYLLPKKLNYNSKRWAHGFSLFPGKKLSNFHNLNVMLQWFSNNATILSKFCFNSSLYKVYNYFHHFLENNFDENNQVIFTLVN